MALRSPRPSWPELPAALRAEIERRLGAPVEAAHSMPGGWSPGSADRVLLADGRRAFVKAASAEANAVTVALHRRESAVLAALSGSGTAPDLLAVAEEGPWFALAVEDVDGRHPDPADEADARAVLDAVSALPDPVPAAVPPADEDLRAVLEDGAAGWQRLLDDGGAGEVPGGAAAVRDLLDLAAGAGEAVGGAGLVHADLRLDNVLIDGSGRARLVDWPNALRGAAWFDGLTYVLDAHRLAPRRGPVLPAHPLLDAVEPDRIAATIAALAGYFLDAARRPPAPGLEGVRAFQREQGLVLLSALAPHPGAGGQDRLRC